MDHVFRGCVRASEIWALVPHVDLNINTPFRSWPLHNLSIDTDWKSHPWKLALPFVHWFIWKRRNAWVFCMVNVKPQECLLKATLAFTKFAASLPCLAIPPTQTSPPNQPVSQQTWLPPTHPWVKLNVDASWKKDSFVAGIAASSGDRMACGFMGLRPKGLQIQL